MSRARRFLARLWPFKRPEPETILIEVDPLEADFAMGMPLGGCPKKPIQIVYPTHITMVGRDAEYELLLR